MARTTKTIPEGQAKVSSASRDVFDPRINQERVYKYLQNIHLAGALSKLCLMVYPKSPDVYVTNPSGELDEKLKIDYSNRFERVGGWRSIQTVIPDVYGYGASPKSIGVEKINGVWDITEIRDLPPRSFNIAMGFYIANQLLPGISVTPEGETKYYQTDINEQIHELHNVTVVIDDDSPRPAGRSKLLGVYPYVALLEYCNKASQQSVSRVGAPMMLPRVSPDAVSTTDYNDKKAQVWFEQFAKGLSKDTAFLIPPWIEFPDIKFRESDIALRIADLCVKYISDFFNPVSFLQSDSSTLGTSDATRGEIYADYIASLQELATKWLADKYTDILQMNGYADYTMHIDLQRPKVDKSAVKLQMLSTGIAGKALTVSEIRDNLTELNLPETTDEVKAELETLYATPQNVGFALNNIKNFTKQESRTIDQIETDIKKVDDNTTDRVLEILGYKLTPESP